MPYLADLTNYELEWMDARLCCAPPRLSPSPLRLSAPQSGPSSLVCRLGIFSLSRSLSLSLTHTHTLSLFSNVMYTQRWIYLPRYEACM